ncbi:MAG: PilZ domain-containing protein [Bdellovibrionales bacterium]|nr:PilZ domain-containing protein [Bdellovibrionales bacterium]
MSSRATKFYPRAPRYTLNPNDNRFMRYAHKDDQGRSFTTRFLDISQTGLAFITDPENAPHISDLIKVEIPLSGDESIAWWARVVRVEEYEPHKWYMKKDDFQDENQVLVCITFHELPPGHSRQIQETLEKKFIEQQAIERAQRMQNLALFLASQTWRILIYATLVAATIWALYYLSRPTLNYDAKKGAPWGERFPSLMLQPENPKLDE